MGGSILFDVYLEAEESLRKTSAGTADACKNDTKKIYKRIKRRRGN